MRLPTSIRDSRPEEPQTRAADEEPSGTGLARKALTAVALAALAYLLWRRSRSGEPVQWADEEGEGYGEAGEAGGRQVPIDEPPGTGAGATGPEEPPASVDPTLEEVDERVEEDVDEEPAEPGEVTVSEEVAEEAGEEDRIEDAGEVGERPEEGEAVGEREAEPDEEAEEPVDAEAAEDDEEE